MHDATTHVRLQLTLVAEHASACDYGSGIASIAAFTPAVFTQRPAEQTALFHDSRVV